MYNNDFIERTAHAWGISTEEALDLLDTKYQQSIRLNPFKRKKSTLASLKKHMTSVEPLTWAPDCYIIEHAGTKPSQLPEFNNSEYIVQNAASFITVLELDPKPGDEILDMAAAPGGKSGHIASVSNNKGQLLLNDTSRNRFFKMQKLMADQGVKADYSLHDGRYLSKQYGHDKFDKILLDAPCSGEANLKPGDDSWNKTTVKRLQKLQIRLLSEAFALLKPGGTLIYSTCTIAPEENEAVVDSLLRHNTAAIVQPIYEYPVSKTKPVLSWLGKDYDSQIINCLRLLPSTTCKPFFIAKLTKTSNSQEDDSYEKLKKKYKTT